MIATITLVFNPTIQVVLPSRPNMETKEESWFPHLLSFILPIVAIGGV